jgi:hypothetical protein
MTQFSEFLAGLKPIDSYHYSGGPLTGSVSLSARSHAGGLLTMQGQRTGMAGGNSSGTLTTPFGSVAFRGMRSVLGGERVTLGDPEGSSSGELVLPALWGILSCCNRAKLQVSGNAELSFDVWRPTVRFDETIGRYRLRHGKRERYKLFSRTADDRMFQGESTIAQLPDTAAIVVLTGLLYWCLDPGLTVDRD